MARVLVAGATGFLGLNLLEALLDAGHNVLGIGHDELPADAARALKNRPGRLDAVRLDLVSDPGLGELVRDFRPTHVVNAAAITPAADVDPAQAPRVIDVNILAALRLLEAARDAGVERLLQPSSAAVYGDEIHGPRPVTEESEVRPRTLYAVTKLTVERLALDFGARHGLDLVATRIGGLFGPWERDTGLRATLSQPFQLAHAARTGAEAVIHPTYRRDWCYAPDVARVLVRLLLQPGALPHRLFNVGHGAAWPLADLCTALAGRFSNFRWRESGASERPTVDYYEDPALTRQPLAIGRLQEAIGGPGPDHRGAVAHYADWLLAHP